MRISKILAALAPVVLGGSLAIVASALPASAVTPACAPLATVADHGYQVPFAGGLALDAVGWGGSGARATACTGALVNDGIVVYNTAHAGVAADFTPVQTTTAGLYSLVYTPGNYVSLANPLCVSTVTDVLRAYARLRSCGDVTVTYNSATGQATLVGGAANNEWQNFKFADAGDGFFQISASTEATPGPFVLNDKGFSKVGPVISYTPTSGENQIWETVTAP